MTASYFDHGSLDRSIGLKYLKFLVTLKCLFQTPFQRLVRRMTRFHTMKSPDKTLHKLKEILDKLKYNFKVNSPYQVGNTVSL